MPHFVRENLGWRHCWLLGQPLPATSMQVQIVEAHENRPLETVRTVLLKSPGYRGYVRDVEIMQVSDESAAIALDIEMKAMHGIVLSEVFVVGSDGSVRQVSKAESRDLDP